MELFIALLVTFWIVGIVLFGLIDAMATSRSSGAHVKTNWWLVVLLTGFLATFSAAAVTGIVSLF